MTVKELIGQLQKLPQDKPVKVWLPGSTISLSSAFDSDRKGLVLIEGNVDEGSALDRALAR